MAPADRDRQGRQQKFNDIGNEGRMTGIRPPSNVPRDSAGNERPSAYFDDDEQDQYDEQQQQERAGSQSASNRQVNGASQQSSQVQGGKRSRPDLFAELGERGRKTGVRVAPVERDEEGFEGVSNFFHSSPSAKATSSPGRPLSTAKKSAARKSMAVVPDDEEEDYQEDEERPYNPNDGRDYGGGGPSDDEQYDYTADMQIDDGSSLTPSAYQRINSANSNRLPPSSLRQSVTAGQSASKGKTNGRPTSASEETDSEEEEEVVKKIVGASQNVSRKSPGGGLSMLAAGKGKGKSSPKGKGRRVASSDEDSASDSAINLQEEQDDSEVEEVAVRQVKSNKKAAAKPAPKGRLSNVSAASTSTSASGTSRGKSTRRESKGSPLVRLGKGGKEVPVKPVSSKAKTGKGKGKEVASPEAQDDEEPEEYFGDDYDDQDQDQSMEVDREQEPQSGSEREGSEEEEEEPVRTAKPAKAAASKKRVPAKKTAAAQAAKNKQPRSQPKEIRERPQKRQREDTADEEGVRRSSRHRLQPLEYWRNERAVYKRRQSGLLLEEVVRIPEVPKQSFSHSNKRKGGRAGSAKVKNEEGKWGPPEEEGVDDATDPDGIVWSWEGNAEVSRRIAFTAKMVDPRPTHNNKFMFQKIYTELDYLAGGILQIPAGAEKPTKPAKDNSYMFYCIEGSVSVVVHRTRFAIGPGATFFVPRGNSYSITATSHRDVKLFFTQGRRVLEAEDGSTRADTLEDSRRVSLSQAGAAQEEEEGEEEQEDEREDGSGDSEAE